MEESEKKKVWILYDDPYSEGYNLYGIFSTEEKANKAKEIFSAFTPNELSTLEFELDELEKHFERALSGYHIYVGRKRRFNHWKPTIRYGEWEDIRAVSLDSFLNDTKREDSVIELDYCVDFRIKAKSPKEAEEIADKIFAEKGEHYNIWIREEQVQSK